MPPDPGRFQRLPAGSAGGVKIALRQEVNPSLPRREAEDAGGFARLLHSLLGPPDRRGDSPFSYSIRDTVTGVEFEVYGGAGGPAYGGCPDDHFINFDGGDNRTRPEVLRVLAIFEEWLASAAFPSAHSTPPTSH